MNDDHHVWQFDFYLKGRILEVSKFLPVRNIMSLILPASTNVTSVALDFIQGLFSRPSPAALRKADAGDVWALYSMSRGRDSVSPAVLQKLADNAA